MTWCPICSKTPCETYVTHAGLPEKKKTNIQELMTLEPVFMMVRSAVKLPEPWVTAIAPRRQPAPDAGGMDIDAGGIDAGTVGDAAGELTGGRTGTDGTVDGVAAGDCALRPTGAWWEEEGLSKSENTRPSRLRHMAALTITRRTGWSLGILPAGVDGDAPAGAGPARSCRARSAG